jgi:hypothetical protein
MATIETAFCRAEFLMMCRQMAQLSGNPWMKITNGLSELMVSGVFGVSLLTKWNLNPLCKVRIW